MTLLLNRRSVLQGVAATTLLPNVAFAQDRLLTRRISSTGVEVPAVGLGSWITFNVGRDAKLLDESKAVIAAFLEAGGTLIDSSPMYGSAQNTIGYGLESLPHANVFSADKVWTPGGEDAASQIGTTKDLWGISRLSLLQVHNLVEWREHLPMLKDMKKSGQLGHVGITTSHGRRHAEMEEIMTSFPLDFVQLTYNPVDRAAEDRLLPIARERDLVVIVNRPFRGGSLVRALDKRPLPDFAAEVQAKTWAQLIIKFILSSDAATLPIPATTMTDHVRENVEAARTPLLDSKTRKAVVDAIVSS